MSFNAPAYSAAMLAGGTVLSNYLGRRARGTAPLRVLPVSKSADQQQQLIQLRRLVARNTPQTSNYYRSDNFSTTAAAVFHGFDLPITANFTASADFDAQVIGDRYYNVALHLRVDIPRDLPRFRLFIYWAKKASNTSAILTFEESTDPAAFTLLYDRMFYPSVEGTSVANIRLNLKKIQTIYNKSSDILERGDLRVRLIADNPTAAVRTIKTTSRLFLQNK